MSPVIKYDVTDVEPNEGAYLQPQPGLYDAKIVELNPRNSDGKNDIEVIVEVITKGEFQGAKLWSYINQGEASRWKMREFTDALDLPAKGGFDTTKNIGKKVRIKVTAGSWEGEYRARLQRFLKPGDSVDGDDGAASGDVGYDDWSDDDIKAELEEKELKVAGRWTREKAVALLEEADDGSGGGNDDDAAAASEPEDEYDEWSLDDLKAEAEEKGILGNVPGRKTKEKLIEALRAAAGGSGDDAAAGEDDYDEWDIEELIQEAKDRDLEIPSGRKTTEKMIALLREDDNADPFEEDK